ncbi:MAG: SpoIIE family protein phosphatase [Leptonema sp. (in: Bacteria)]|nr:SpoIIE family protein phosphatase [Leptonema sp. (in: bacteria)]
MNSIKKLLAYLKPHSERKQFALQFRAYRNQIGLNMQRPVAILASVAWLGFAFDTDPKLHPEMPEMLYFRLGLTVVSIIVLIASFIKPIRGQGLGWLYVLFTYVFLSTAFFTGEIADDANYVSGLQIIVLIIILAPITMRHIVIYYPLSILFFIAGILYAKPVLNTAAAIYSLQNLFISYAIGIVFGFVLDNARFDGFYKNLKLAESRDEIEQQMKQVQALKRQQDGDYFLTSLLIKPLLFNGNKSKSITTEFFLKQKKQFEFGKRSGEIGGDICITGNLRIGNSLAQHSRYTVFLNADAMGKSLQGAGGAIIAGVLMNSIMAQSARNDRVIQTTPEEWLTRLFDDFNRIFLSFDGSMLLSAVAGLISEETKEMWYFNVEHPQPVLLRNSTSKFLEESQHLYKFGALEHQPFEVTKIQLLVDDIIITASDGRDDLAVYDNLGKRHINEDETVFLDAVKKAEGNLNEIYNQLKTHGEITDDLSMIKIKIIELALKAKTNIDTQKLNQLISLKQYNNALTLIVNHIDEVESNLKLKKIYAVVLFKLKDYQRSYSVLSSLLEVEPNNSSLLYRIALASIKIGNIDKAKSYIEAALQLNPKNERYQNLLTYIHQNLQ